MRLLKAFILLFCTIIAICGCGDDKTISVSNNNTTNAGNKNSNRGVGSTVLERLEFPKVKGGSSFVVTHSTASHGINYSLEWDSQKRSQRWSCYQMYASNTAGTSNVGRYDTQQNGYPQDPDIPASKRFASDPYWGSGYDHGHICPSADRQYSEEANMQTFYISNMQPQRNVFNAGLWAKMESQVRSWNSNAFRDTLFVCKGGTIDTIPDSSIKDPVMRKLSSGLIVPHYFFMAVLCKNSQGYKAMAFWTEHYETDHTKDALSTYVVNVRDLEEKTGIDFFCNLPDDVEERVETQDVATILRIWNLTNK